MGQTTIPQLFEIESLGPNSLIPVDTGVQTFKARLSNLGRDALQVNWVQTQTSIQPLLHWSGSTQGDFRPSQPVVDSPTFN